MDPLLINIDFYYCKRFYPDKNTDYFLKSLREINIFSFLDKGSIGVNQKRYFYNSPLYKSGNPT